MRRTTIKQPEKLLHQIEAYFESTDESKFAAKLQGVLLLLRDKNNNCSEVARLIGKTPQTVAGWVRKLFSTPTHRRPGHVPGFPFHGDYDE